MTELAQYGVWSGISRLCLQWSFSTVTLFIPLTGNFTGSIEYCRIFKWGTDYLIYNFTFNDSCSFMEYNINNGTAKDNTNLTTENITLRILYY